MYNLEEILQTSKVSGEWKSALIHPLRKKSFKTDVNSYREITYKVLSKALLFRTVTLLDLYSLENVGEVSQNG